MAVGGFAALGVPGEAAKADWEGAPADTVPREARFMQEMILHHAQALELARLAPERTDNDEILAFMRRVEVAQQDEIGLMERWLERRGHEVPGEDEVAAHARGVPEDPEEHEGQHAPADAHQPDRRGMAGMLTREEFEALEEARGTEFDRLLLEGMIYHHEGAIIMVQELLETPRAVADSEVFNLVTHVETVQQSEITRMQRMLRDLDDEGGAGESNRRESR